MVLYFGGKRSRMAHSFATEFVDVKSGSCVTACDLRPYDHARNPLDVAFGVDDAAPRCLGCVETLEGRLAA